MRKIFEIRGAAIKLTNTVGMVLQQSMTEAVFLTLGQSQSSHLKKLGLRPNA